MANITVEFEVGDVVSLNSGGPNMTVSSVNKGPGTISTTWFEWSIYGYTGEPHSDVFDAAILTLKS